MDAEKRQAWLAERKLGIGGSDAGAILGFSPWSTPLDVWMDKLGKKPPKEENEAMKTGTFLEQYVADRYQEETGRRVVKHNFMIHGEGDKSCLLANLDRLVIPEGEKIAAHHGVIRTNLGLECKTAGWDWENGVPLHYQAQVHHYMGLCPTIEKFDVAVLFRNSLTFKIYEVLRNDDLIAEMQEKEMEFWNRYVLTGTPPPPETEDDCKKLWARHNPGKTLVANSPVALEGFETVADVVARYKELADAEKEIKGQMDPLKTELVKLIGDCEAIVDLKGDALVTYRSPTATPTEVVDWEALAREKGVTDEEIAAHTKTEEKQGARRFLLARPKKAKGAKKSDARAA